MKIILKNIQCYDEFTYELEPNWLTVVAGDNSSGKSTIFKTLRHLALGQYEGEGTSDSLISFGKSIGSYEYVTDQYALIVKLTLESKLSLFTVKDLTQDTVVYSENVEHLPSEWLWKIFKVKVYGDRLSCLVDLEKGLPFVNLSRAENGNLVQQSCLDYNSENFLESCRGVSKECTESIRELQAKRDQVKKTYLKEKKDVDIPSLLALDLDIRYNILAMKLNEFITIARDSLLASTDIIIPDTSTLEYIPSYLLNELGSIKDSFISTSKACINSLAEIDEVLEVSYIDLIELKDLKDTFKNITIIEESENIVDLDYPNQLFFEIRDIVGTVKSTSLELQEGVHKYESISDEITGILEDLEICPLCGQRITTENDKDEECGICLKS